MQTHPRQTDDQTTNCSIALSVHKQQSFPAHPYSSTDKVTTSNQSIQRINKFPNPELHIIFNSKSERDALHYKQKWHSLGLHLNKRTEGSEKGYKSPQSTHYNPETDRYAAHPTYGNDKAARDRNDKKILGQDFVRRKDDQRHSLSTNHGPHANDQQARDRDAQAARGQDFGCKPHSSRRSNSKVGQRAVKLAGWELFSPGAEMIAV
jgi:hypothetical protein